MRNRAKQEEGGGKNQNVPFSFGKPWGVRATTLCFAMWQSDENQALLMDCLESWCCPYIKKNHSVKQIVVLEIIKRGASSPLQTLTTNSYIALQNWTWVNAEDSNLKQKKNIKAINLPTPYFSCSVGIHMFMVGTFTWVVGIAAKCRVLVLCNAFYWCAFLRSVVGVIV